MIKRVVGLPGDLVELEAGRLIVNCEPVDDRPRVPGASIQTWRVPGTSYFMAGDNTSVSDDSRVWDEPFVPVESVEAVVRRRLMGPHRPKGFTPRRRAAAAHVKRASARPQSLGSTSVIAENLRDQRHTSR